LAPPLRPFTDKYASDLLVPNYPSTENQSGHLVPEPWGY
jgi:hypothetical protein